MGTQTSPALHATAVGWFLASDGHGASPPATLIRGGRSQLYKLRDLGMGCKPDIAIGLGVTDDLVQDPDT